MLLKNPFAVLLAGLSGGMVGFASNMVIKVTSSISLKVRCGFGFFVGAPGLAPLLPLTPDHAMVS